MNLYNLKLVCHLLASSIIPVVFTRERLSVEAISQSFNCWNQTISCPTFSCAFIHSKPRLNKRHAGLWSILLNLLNYPLVIQLDNRRSNATNKSMGKTTLWISAYFCLSFSNRSEFPCFGVVVSQVRRNCRASVLRNVLRLTGIPVWMLYYTVLLC